ncbi:MAG TPA: GNAT family N-acetyltransferase [Bacillales bacterium]|nr:GNAT family N-acetyltransferase [Bacillales bacterium]
MNNRIRIKQIDDPDVKQTITESVLRELPEWFGIESALVEYIERSKLTIFYAALNNGELAGFISITENFKETAEIYVMGVRKANHRKGIGGMLVDRAERDLKKRGFRLLEVKTLSGSHPDENYKRTRAFYKAIGFLPLDEQKELWDPQNPCLIMVKWIGD